MAKKHKKAAKKSPAKQKSGELRDEEAAGVTGGAYQAYVTQQGTKQGPSRP